MEENSKTSTLNALREIQEKFPGVKISEAPIEPVGSLTTRIDVFERFLIHMYEMSRLLWVTDKKFRVTIECDPESGQVSAKRECF